MDEKETTVSMFQRFADAKGVKFECEVCGKPSGWNVYTHANAHAVIPSGRDGDLYMGPYGINAIAMKCRNCANIRLFELEAVLDWVGHGPQVIEVRPKSGA